jgi:1-acyl-sn-glycerol-3-phosphate acyltransferase
VRGQENIPDGPAVYMPNHVSHFDVYAILGYLNVQFRWTVKKELFKIPLLGLGMRRAGYIMVDRGNHKKAMESMKLASDKIRSGTSIVIFPEGTRSYDGTLQYPFKKGGFHLALDAGVPVIPVTVSGTRDILPKYGIHVRPGKIILTIGKPIYPAGHDVASLMEEVYKSIKLGYTS